MKFRSYFLHVFIVSYFTNTCLSQVFIGVGAFFRKCQVMYYNVKRFRMLCDLSHTTAEIVIAIIDCTTFAFTKYIQQLDNL